MVGLQDGEQKPETKAAPVVFDAENQLPVRRSKFFGHVVAVAPVFTMLSAFAACASSYFAYASQDSAYKAIVLTSQIDAAASAIADGQRLTVVLKDLANFSDDLLPLQDNWLSVQSGRIKLSEAETANIKQKMQFIIAQVQQHLTDLGEIGKKLHQSVVKMALVFPNEVWGDFNNAVNIGNDLINNNAVLLKNTRYMNESLVRQDASSMRDAQFQIVESREAIRRSKERINQMENSISIASVKVASYLSAQRFARKPG